MNRALIISLAFASFGVSAAPQCFGEGAYRVCSESYVDEKGNMQVRSWDSQGNRYGVGTETIRGPGNNAEVRSSDTMGNSYSVKTWTDAQGTHSVDRMGNRCTITRTGRMIGCGQ